MLENGILQDNTYRVFVPIGEHDLMKSVEVDENGDYIVQGVMTSDDKDEENDSITPEGMDCSYFLEKGWVKYEHGNSPEAFIGEPLEVKIGRFMHPTLHKAVNGIHIKSRLFAQRELAQQAVKAIQDLQKSHTKRCMGWSIEGNVKERDRKTGKIIKSVLRNVVLTMNPVNTMTFAELAKSFSKNHELTIDMDVEKSMDIAGAAAITPQSLEGAPKDDKQQKWLDIFRSFCRSNFLQKSLRKSFVASTPATVGMTAYEFGLDNGLDNEEAFQFASYIADKHNILKSLFTANLGGEKMEKLASLLDTDLEELRKSLEVEDEEENELLKSKNKEDSEEGDEEEGSEEGDDEEEGSEEGDDEEEGSEEGDDEEEGTEKSLKSDFAKSLAAQEENAKALEVSDFLSNLVDEVGFQMDGFSKSMTYVTKQQSAITKALMSVGELIKGLSDKVESLEAENGELQKSLNGLLERPVGRKSVVSTREAVTLQKSMGSEGVKPATQAQIGAVLMKSFEAGELAGSEVARFEAGVSLDKLRLPASVKQELGL
jgi:hypothetical protein